MQTPRAELRPFVERFLIVEASTAHRDMHLPDVGLFAAFVLRGECILNRGQKSPGAALTGLWQTARTHDHSHDNIVMLAAFTTLGAAAFLRFPLDEVANGTTELAGTLGRRDELDRLRDQLAATVTPATRVRLLEDFLLAHRLADAPDPLVAAAVSMIKDTQAHVRIGEVVRRVGLSQSALERRFRAAVGVSPRGFASIVRLRHVVRLRMAGHDFTTIAHAAGYFDQPHFNKDFKRVTGVAPEEYFARAGCEG